MSIYGSDQHTSDECSPDNGGIWANYDKEGDLWC